MKKLKKIIKNINLKILYYLFPKSVAHKVLYRKRIKKKLNLKNPRNFNEKIQWLLVNKYDKNYGLLSDKYAVKQYIESKGYKDILPKLYAVYDNANQIDFELLPDKFVLKPNNGCGNVWICIDKSKFDIKKCKKMLNKALKDNFAISNLEYHYSYIKPKIICEEYLDDKENYMPIDYKFYCFKGVVDSILICSERNKNLRLNYYDTNWNELDYSLEKYRSSKKFKKPVNLDQMINIASDLSKDFEFVRVDLYEINNKVYFGELTFSPASGMVYYNSDYALKYYGDLLELGDKK